jgi:RND family efflux transporter MFP subunit
MVAAAAPSMAQAKKKGGRPPMQVGIDAVISQSINQTVPVIGRFVARQAGVIAARINGPVGEIRAEVGDRVKAGDVIAVLVDDALKWQHELQIAEEQQFRAAVGTGQARLKLRRQELKRLERLKKSAAFSQARLEDKRQEVAVALSQLGETQGRLASARAERKLTEINLYNATVRAPYSGVITKRHTEVGAYVKVGDPLVTVVDNTQMEIEAEVPANHTAGLKPSTKVVAFLNPSTRIPAVVRAVVPDENPQTRTRTVRFVPDFSTHQGDLAANQSVTLQLPVNGGGTAITVHKDAIITRRGKSVVYLAKDSKAELRPVRLGDAVGSRFIVKSGLAVGDLVVVRGNERLKPGQKIRYKGNGQDKNKTGSADTSSDRAKTKDKG